MRKTKEKSENKERWPACKAEWGDEDRGKGEFERKGGKECCRE